MRFIDPISKSFHSSYKILNKNIQFITSNIELMLLLFLTFIMRFYLMKRIPYWLDELLSVVVRGINLDSGMAVLNYHREIGSATPLYEFILYNWMQIFGHSEISTRTLSSIFVCLATLFFYLFILRFFSRRTALAATLFFNLSYMALYYSLEARYYSLTLLLSTLSSYLLVMYLTNLNNKFSLKNLILNKGYTLYSIVNIALMLTHLTNYMFIAGQALFVLICFIKSNKSQNVVINLMKVTLLFALQFTAMIMIWNSSIVSMILRRFDIWKLLIIFILVLLFISTILYLAKIWKSKLLKLTGWSRIGLIVCSLSTMFLGLFYLQLIADTNILSYLLQEPLILLFNFIIAPNIAVPIPLYFALLLLTLIVFVKNVIKIFLKSKDDSILNRNLIIIYQFLLILLPSFLIKAILTLNLGGDFSGGVHWERYFIFCTPPLMLLLIITLENAVCLVHKLMSRIKHISIKRHYVRHALLYSFIIFLILIMPMSYEAAMKHKHNWKGIAQQIVSLIQEDENHNYLIYEVSSNPHRLLDYYLSTYSDSIKVNGTIYRHEEAKMASDINYIPIFERDERFITNPLNDYLIVAFPHDRSPNYPITLNKLNVKYNLHVKFVDDRGRGFFVFKIHDDLVPIK